MRFRLNSTGKIFADDESILIAAPDLSRNDPGADAARFLLAKTAPVATDHRVSSGSGT